MKVEVTGQKDLYKLARTLRDAGQRKLGQKLDRGIRKAAKVVDAEVTARSSTDVFIPKKFEETFNASLSAKHEVRMIRGRSVTITFTAKGKRQERKLTDMERGRLRHPVYGRYRRLKDGTLMKNPWVTQTIKPGVISVPAKRAEPKAVKVLDEAVNELVKEINAAV